MVNPVQLLFGNFDLAFVIIFILPLLIIAFTFNILSKEKELGTLRIIGAQPISIVKWLLQKMAIRYMVFSLIVFGILLATLAVFTANAFTEMDQVLELFLIIAGYNLFWFVAAAIVNIKINDSSKNAIALIGVWLLVVLVLPATINQIGNSLYPIPSRLNMINEIRLIKKENEEKQNEIMDEYMRNHPELSEGNNDQNFGFWHNYFASEKMMEEKTKQLLAEYELQLKKQQDLITTFKYVSPAILMQQTLNNIAGTSEKHYNDYKIQVFEFSTTWRNYLVPMLFKEQKFTEKNYHELPEFHYKNRIETNFWLHLFAIIGMSTVLFFVIMGKGLKSNPILK